MPEFRGHAKERGRIQAQHLRRYRTVSKQVGKARCSVPAEWGFRAVIGTAFRQVDIRYVLAWHGPECGNNLPLFVSGLTGTARIETPEQ